MLYCLGVLQGALSRWLMPFDANTSVADQSHVRVANPNDSNSGKVVVNPSFKDVTVEKRREMTHNKLTVIFPISLAWWMAVAAKLC